MMSSTAIVLVSVVKQTFASLASMNRKPTVTLTNLQWSSSVQHAVNLLPSHYERDYDVPLSMGWPSRVNVQPGGLPAVPAGLPAQLY